MRPQAQGANGQSGSLETVFHLCPASIYQTVAVRLGDLFVAAFGADGRARIFAEIEKMLCYHRRAFGRGREIVSCPAAIFTVMRVSSSSRPSGPRRAMICARFRR